MPGRICLAAAVAALVGCADGAGGAPGGAGYIAVIDSASIPTVSVDWQALLDPSTELPFDSLRVLTAVGGAPAEGDDLFEVVGVAPAGEDRWILGQRGDPHFVVVEGGAVARREGRDGDGPGEFRNLWTMTPASDGGIFAYEISKRLLVHMTPDLEVIETWPVPVESPELPEIPLFTAVPMGALGPGDVLFSVLLPWTDPESLPGAGDDYSVQRRSDALLALNAGGGVRVVVPSHPGMDALLSGSGGMLVADPPVFGKRSVYRTAAGGVYSLDTGTGSITAWEETGEATRRLHFPTRDTVPSEPLLEAAVQHRVDSANASGGVVSPILGEWSRQYAAGGPVPVLRDFVVTDSGVIWVFFDPVSTPEGADVVIRVDPAAMEVARYHAPVRPTPYGADDDRVWGMTRDDLDVEIFAVLGRSPAG